MATQVLQKPFVVDPTLDFHTHTVVFLHRFPDGASPSDIDSRVLASKRTKNHKTLAEQFPTVRWVFPRHKASRPYANLTTADRASVGLIAPRIPYITEIVLQEAARLAPAGGLSRVVLGGQGETAVAAHDALASFPDLTPALRATAAEDDAVPTFLRETFFADDWADAAADPRLAGFVGMHADAGGQTRDCKTYGAASKAPNEPVSVNRSIVRNTPHCFIHGGFKMQTATWDGRRIDETARFLEDVVGVIRIHDDDDDERKRKAGSGKDVLDVKDRSKKEEHKDTLTEAQKYALQLAKDKKENGALVEKIKVRIEADKVTRKVKQARERERRLAAAGLLTEDLVASPTKDDVSATLDTDNSASLVVAQRRALERLQTDKAAQEALERARQLIEADRIERKIKQEREQQRRLALTNQAEPNMARSSSSTPSDSDNNLQIQPHLRNRSRPTVVRRCDSDGQPWQAQDKTRGQMSEGQMRALGLLPEEEIVSYTSPQS